MPHHDNAPRFDDLEGIALSDIAALPPEMLLDLQTAALAETARVKRLRSRKAHAENPASLTHRMIANVRLLERDGDELGVTANFIVHRARDGQTNSFPGRYVHRLQVTEDGLRFRLRRAVLSLERLEAGARLSFIL